MRMWLCDPKILCRKHLLGEHLEQHMFLGSVKKGKKLDGFLTNNLFEPDSLFLRHEQLKNEMIARGYKHRSPMKEEDLDLSEERQKVKINKDKALRDLLSRCPECHQRWISQLK